MKLIEKRVLLILIAAILFSSAASAEILLGQTKSTYNIGDSFEIPITLTSARFTSDFFTAALVCEQGEEIEIFKSPFTIKEDEQKEFTISTVLGNFLVGGRSGKCHLRTQFDNDQADSQEFEVISNVYVVLNVEGATFSPGDTIVLFGNAVKGNDEFLNGYVEIEVPRISLKLSGPVTEGDFRLNFTLPSNAGSGDYEIKATAYESDEGGGMMNQGVASNKIKIKQIIKKIDIGFDKELVAPGSEIFYTVMVYDQAGDIALTDASSIITSAADTIAKKSIVKTNSASSFKTELNSTPGYWRIDAKAGNLEISKTFLVEEFAKVEFSLNGQILTVTNIGNVLYSKPIEVVIGGVNEVKELDIPVGGSKKFKLVAPDGNYDIEVSDGTNKQIIGSTFLTGRAVSVEEFGASSKQNMIILFGLIGILILAIIIAFVYRKISKNRLKGGKIPAASSVAKTTPSKTATLIEKSSTNLIDKGEMKESEIVALHVKNEGLTPESPAFKALDSALWKATEAGAKVYTDGEYRVMVFNELLTKQRDNALLAISTAQSIERSLKEYNRRSAQKLNFGIGINSGKLIVEKREGKFRFISPDNSIGAAKKIAREADSQILVSEAVHRKTVGKIKVEKLKDKNYWALDKVIDRSAHEDFIKGFVSRQKFEQRKY